MEVFASFGMLQRQPLLAYCNDSRRCHPLLWHVGGQASFSSALAFRWQWPTSVLAGIDIFAHGPQVPIEEDGKETILAGQNTGSPAVNGDGSLPTPATSCLTPSSSVFPFRRSDPHLSFTSTRFDDGILPTPHLSTCLPSPSSLRRSDSFPTRSGLPQQASSTPVSRSSHPTLEFFQCLQLNSLRTLLHLFFLQHEKRLPSTK